MSDEAEPGYWAEVEAAWEGRSDRPAPRRIGPARAGVLAAMMIGLQEALEPHTRDEVVVEIDLEEPDRPGQRLRLHFDPESPSRTVVELRDGPGRPSR